MNIEVMANYILAFLLVLIAVLIAALCIVRREAIRQHEQQQQAVQSMKLTQKESQPASAYNYRSAARATKAA